MKEIDPSLLGKYRSGRVHLEKWRDGRFPRGLMNVIEYEMKLEICWKNRKSKVERVTVPSQQ